MPNDRECQNCKHWKEETDSHDTERWGTCHRSPPQAVSAGEEVGPVFLFPTTDPMDYCGEFAAPH